MFVLLHHVLMFCIPQKLHLLLHRVSEASSVIDISNGTAATCHVGITNGSKLKSVKAWWHVVE
jgi:hypothetical protein